jgi:hypothetical protein
MIRTASNGIARLTGSISRSLSASSLIVAACGAMIATVMVGLCAVVLYQGR